MSIDTTPLIQRAEERLKELHVPVDQTVFVHCDLAIENAVWDKGTVVGIIDWEGQAPATMAWIQVISGLRGRCISVSGPPMKHLRGGKRSR